MLELSGKGFSMQLFSHLRITFTSICIAHFIVACGGGGSDAGDIGVSVVYRS